VLANEKLSGDLGLFNEVRIDRVGAADRPLFQQPAGVLDHGVIDPRRCIGGSRRRPNDVWFRLPGGEQRQFGRVSLDREVLLRNAELHAWRW
jgi:hypothetical protein